MTRLFSSWRLRLVAARGEWRERLSFREDKQEHRLCTFTGLVEAFFDTYQPFFSRYDDCRRYQQLEEEFRGALQIEDARYRELQEAYATLVAENRDHEEATTQWRTKVWRVEVELGSGEAGKANVLSDYNPATSRLGCMQGEEAAAAIQQLSLIVKEQRERLAQSTGQEKLLNERLAAASKEVSA